MRRHGAQEVEAAKANWLGFGASASGAGFEQAVFSIPSVPLANGESPATSSGQAGERQLVLDLLFPLFHSLRAFLLSSSPESL